MESAPYRSLEESIIFSLFLVTSDVVVQLHVNSF